MRINDSHQRNNIKGSIMSGKPEVQKKNKGLHKPAF